MKSDSTGTDGAIQSNAQKLSPLLVVVGGCLEIKDFLFPYPADANLVHIGLEFLRKRLNGRRTTHYDERLSISLYSRDLKTQYFHTAHKLHSLCYRKQDDES